MLAGANGSGKTTLLRLVAGLERPSAGSVAVFGVDPRKETVDCRRGLTMVSHHAFLYERMTALETLRFWSLQAGAEAGLENLMGLLEEVQLTRFADQEVGGFSAGMRKRLTLLRTRVEAPQLVLWDEPFSALDPAGRRLLSRWVQGFREQGVTMLLATHDIEIGAELCPRALVLDRGQLRWAGPSKDAPAAMESLQ